MKKFDWTKFTKRIAIRADLESVYNAWATSEELEKWFLSSAIFYDGSEKQIPKSSKAMKGHQYQWSWFTQEAYETGSVLGANGKDFISFTFAGDCIVEVNFNMKKDWVIVELIQKEIPTDDVSKVNIRLGCAFGWAFYLVNLKSLLEGGIDLRNKEKGLGILVNN